MSDNSPKSLDMSQVAETMRRYVITAGGPRPGGETVERWLERASRRLGLGYRRTRAIYHREARRIDAHEYLDAKHRVEEMARLRAQIAALEVQQKADLDAMAAQLPVLLGPLYPYAVKAGLINPEAVAAQEDGEG